MCVCVRVCVSVGVVRVAVDLYHGVCVSVVCAERSGVYQWRDQWQLWPSEAAHGRCCHSFLLDLVLLLCVFFFFLPASAVRDDDEARTLMI